MLDAFCIFLLYALQGSIQGVVFGTLPLLVQRNPASTDLHISQFSFVGYPFSFKFLIAPLVDGIFIARVGRRESWLLPLQLLSAIMLGWLSTEIVPMLEASPLDLTWLITLLFVLVAFTAAGDIATDAWAATRMADARASMCQSVGLALGSEASATIFFVLLGRGLMDITMLLRIMSSLGFVVLTCLIFQMMRPPPAVANEDEDDDNIGVGQVVQRIWTLVSRSPNMRWYLLFSFLSPVITGHTGVLGARYQALGFTPEIFSEYDVYLFPVSFLIMGLGGKVAARKSLLTIQSWIFMAQLLLSVATLIHFHRCQKMGEGAVQDTTMRAAYICLNQLNGSLGTILFVVKVAFFNRISQRHAAIAGTVITFCASISNLGGMWPGTLVPLVSNYAGVNAAAALCLVSGFLVQILFWRKVRQVEDLDVAGWEID
eukprot:TRINITY_DN58376_c0_g1_i1.p1 TRINITY_DN58376_c0_g1~~TRINITY_DN58376_c0_g1_i1.p1  ORF type:complete len:430 (+),score=51.48 TRINITY_DN58376_c0_g1_i1:89-1378(+)